MADLHFLRPLWLLLVPAAILLYVWLRRRRDPRRQWQHLIAPHLLDHLLIGGGKSARFRPEHLVALVLGIGGVAMAGPAWSRERPPFADDQAAMVIAIDVSNPNLERAKQKARDLLALRAGAKTGLVAYAGSAHVVLPLTEDREILTMYLEALAPDIMPVQGKAPSKAVRAGVDLLARQETPGSVVVVTDAVPGDDPFAEATREASSPVLMLGVDGFTLDDTDVRRIDGRATRIMQDVQAEDQALAWKDQGWGLVLPLVLLVGLWFRRGWTVRWAVFLLVGLAAMHAGSAHAHESTWHDLWKTPDQQGRWHFERGEYADAAAHFGDPMWKGVALYRAEKYGKAVEAFAQVDTPDAWFNRGNAYAKLEQWDDAIYAYQQVLERAPDDRDAKANLEHALKERAKPPEDPPKGTKIGADKIVQADPDDKQRRAETEEKGYGGGLDESMAEVWMRQVQTTPAAFLKGKFAVQAARKEDE